MKRITRLLFCGLVLTTGIVTLSSFDGDKNFADKQRLNLPYKKAGLTEKQAAAHLLSRFTFGATPGQVDAVAQMGLEKWLRQQFEANQPDTELKTMLAGYETLGMSNTEIVRTFPKGGQLLRMAVKDGAIPADSVKTDRKEYKDEMKAYMEKNGYKPQAELFRQLINQKILHAAYGQNQLQEVLTNFWFNHFNVSLTKNDCAQFITNYEQQVIRPNVLGKFETLLMATAKSPAMLTYLDNFRSVASDNGTPAPPRKKMMEKRLMQQLEARQAADTLMQQMQVVEKVKQNKGNQGLNENYAREIMELHTLGVDGGYKQEDVTQAARILTGWTIYPMEDYGGGEAVRKMIERLGEEKFIKQGFVHDGDFLFAANKHDKGEKTFLNTPFAAGGGYDEGEKLIHMLAHHASTAKFISTKLAIRFVSDNPPASLVDKMAKTFLEKDGDITAVLATMVSAPEFWSPEALREKTKSPFELAISSVRSLDAKVDMPAQLSNWITKMGERLYYYQAPTGFPDRGQYWINTGSLLNRMNFGLALASQRIPGVTFNLAALNGNHEPESAEAALLVYSKILMPERNVEETVKRLTPLINDPEIQQKINDAAAKNAPPPQPMAMQEQGGEMMSTSNGGDEAMVLNKNGQPRKPKDNPKKRMNQNTMQMQTGGNNGMLAQVVGIIIGSPEFQRK